MRILWAVDHGLQSSSERMRRGFGVTGPQRMAIRIIGLCPGVSAGHLSKILHLHPSTLTGVLRRLVERGLVTRSSDARDGRRSMFNLSRRGKTIDRLRYGTIESKVKEALDLLPRREIEITAVVLGTVARALER